MVAGSPAQRDGDHTTQKFNDFFAVAAKSTSPILLPEMGEDVAAHQLDHRMVQPQPIRRRLNQTDQTKKAGDDKRCSGDAAHGLPKVADEQPDPTIAA
jgi:hypothetical protein